MKNILNPEEVKTMLSMFKPQFTNVDAYITVVETDPEWIATILPPPLQPADPIVSITLQKCDQFQGTVVDVVSRFGDKVGSFGLGYIMQSDLTVIYGREGLAEPKKLGDTILSRKGNDFVGSVVRYGQELIRVEATSLAQGDPSTFGDVECFHFKYSIKPDASGLEDVRLLNASFKTKCKSLEIMEPKVVKLNESIHDIYGNIPVKNVVACMHANFDMFGSAQYLADVDSEAFLPYAFWKHDDYTKVMKTW